MQVNAIPILQRAGLAVLVTSVVLLSGCSIKSADPDFTYPVSKAYDGNDWPQLEPTERLLATGTTDTRETEDDIQRLRARAAALRTRAGRLNRAVVPASTRKRLTRPHNDV